MARILTAKQAEFVRVFLKTYNASEAYRCAYPKSQRWTRNAVAVEACRMRKKRKIRLYIWLESMEPEERLARLTEELRKRKARQARDQEECEARNRRWIESQIAWQQKISERAYWER